jgi:hypothetical protein
MVAHDETRGLFLDGPRRREVAGAWPCRLPVISAAFDLRSTNESDPYLYR